MWALGRKDGLGMGVGWVTLSSNCYLEQLRAESSQKTPKFPEVPSFKSLKHITPLPSQGFCASAPQHPTAASEHSSHLELVLLLSV